MPEHGNGADARELVFVYGTLWTASGYREAKRLTRRCLQDLGPASIAGRLYDLGRHPGAVPAQRADEYVHGRLCALTEPETCLQRLDAFEDCHPDRPAHGQFRRERVQARLVGPPRDVVYSCWAYLFNGGLTGRPRIRHGDYRRWLSRRGFGSAAPGRL